LTPAVLVDGIERCQKLGIRQCIPKPVKDTELLEAIHSERNLSEADIVPAPASQVETNHVSLRVLVADDSPINQEVMAGLLEMHGHQVHVADNGVEAIEAFTSHDFDIILMDVEMPEMDGLTASMRIREIEKNQHRRVPILAMTAHVMDSVRIQCMESGMDGYVSKPIQPEELFDALKTFCPQTDFQPTPS
jgi:CheY-like chemotaxis protein